MAVLKKSFAQEHQYADAETWKALVEKVMKPITSEQRSKMEELREKFKKVYRPC
ncbi:MAG: hypothetical protein J5747_06590 [Spirochaetaceae bacterium]|nr:hypothetical protein [Spirochaetaceae bacterium]